jgi:hypothetical protein
MPVTIIIATATIVGRTDTLTSAAGATRPTMKQRGSAIPRLARWRVYRVPALG